MRALFSATDKTGLADFAAALQRAGWELVATGGTAQCLSEAGLAVIDVAALTGYPSILDGRVKTLHPKIFGGILADTDNPQHLSEMKQHGLGEFGLVVCNLYDFAGAPDVETIDIGGPAMLRAAAKNHATTAVVVDPGDYGWVLDELTGDAGLSLESRRKLAAKVFEVCAGYDRQIADWLEVASSTAAPSETAAPGQTTAPSELPETLNLTLQRTHPLRYGENPDQAAARYQIAKGTQSADTLLADTLPSWFDHARLLNGSVETGGKGLSYLNLLDADAAWQLVQNLGQPGQTPNQPDQTPAAVAVKHTNPCGVALADDLATAWLRAHDCDPVSVFGAVVAFSQEVPAELAERLADIFLEVIVAPSYGAEALEILGTKKNLRLLEVPAVPSAAGKLDIRSAAGGLLIQTLPEPDQPDTWETATRRSPTQTEMADLAFAWKVAAAVQSNAIVLASDRCAVGIGAGQQNRKTAAELAVRQAEQHSPEMLAGSVCASDAFFPFRDGLDVLAEAGCRAVIQPGGSVRDAEVIEAADQHEMAMVFTRQRRFSH